MHPATDIPYGYTLLSGYHCRLNSGGTLTWRRHGASQTVRMTTVTPSSRRHRRWALGASETSGLANTRAETNAGPEDKGK